MSEYLEIEKKYQVNGASLDDLLAHFEYVGEKRVVDEYVDTAEGEWYQRGIFIRIRNGGSLDIKFNPDHLDKTDATDHVACHEYNFREPFGEGEAEQLRILKNLIGLEIEGVDSFATLLERNQLESLMVIDKSRKTYGNEDFVAVIDNIQGLGIFLEIEYTGPEGRSLESVLEEIDRLMKAVPATPLNSGSFEMILREQNYELYRKGKYLLADDLEADAA